MITRAFIIRSAENKLIYLFIREIRIIGLTSGGFGEVVPAFTSSKLTIETVEQTRCDLCSKLTKKTPERRH